jgi:hypothetical protein
MLDSTSKFKVLDIPYKNEKVGFAIARGYWDGDTTKIRLACRWYEDGGMGYPQTFGKPQWMMLPEDDISLQVTETVDLLNRGGQMKAVITLT